MRAVALVLLCGLADGAGAQTIEGYWQDTERRILFSTEAPAGYVYGRWTALDQQQTYPSAKQIRRSAGGFELIDLLYDDEETVKVVGASDERIDFVRTNKLSRCSAYHACRLEGRDQLFCALETRCPEAGAEQLVWRGEEHYARRASCERDGKRQAQGIPHRCR
ncbi:MAG TPA: hypothetical protein VEQ87_17805 [Burkholderiales bacterium]|nr:hypothetical protein [Burkholderiales bacterium]